MNVLVANIPLMFCAALGLLSVYTGHPSFGIAFVVMAFLLGHSVKNDSDA